MSLGYLELKRTSVSETLATYDVLSADFSTIPGHPAHIGVLTIDHRLKTRSFAPAGELRGVKIAPLDLFDRSEAEVTALVAGEYADFAAPKVVRKLAFVSKSFIDQGKSPERWL
jgi:hypothetical protein